MEDISNVYVAVSTVNKRVKTALNKLDKDELDNLKMMIRTSK